MAELTQLGKYEITRLLGEGGMGKVYEGVDPVLDRRVAVKVLHKHLSAQGGFRDRFLREARILANLKHKSITQIYEAGESDDGLYLVMEFVDGQTLEECLFRGMYRSSPHALQIVRQVCDALDHAHHSGIIHRDIKPSNIMIKPNGEVMLMDFGIARLDGQSAMTQDGQALGTPQYMSPEQCKGAQVDGRSDIYSLAIVVYEMLSGARPFEGENFLSIINRQMTVTPPSISVHAASIPKPMSRAIAKALSKDATARQQSATQFYDELAGARAPSTTVPRPPPVRDTPTSKSGPTVIRGVRDKRRLVLLVVAILTTLAVVGLVGWIYMSMPKPGGVIPAKPPPKPAAPDGSKFEALKLTDQAEQCVRDKQLNTAEELLKQAVTADPTCINALLDMCAVLYGQKRYKEARNYWQMADKVNPDETMVQHWDNALRAKGF